MDSSGFDSRRGNRVRDAACSISASCFASIRLLSCSKWCLFFFSSLLLFFSSLLCYAQETKREQKENSSFILYPSSLVVTGAGMAAFNGDIAAAQEEAVWDAKRNAVEQAFGLFLKSKTLGRNFSVAEDEISGRTEGFVRRWEVVEGSQRIETVAVSVGEGKAQPRILHIEVRATVELISLVRRLADMADVYKDLERPRLRVQITGRGEYAGVAERIQSELAGALKAQGFDVASEGAAEVVLKGALEVVPTLRMGDKNAPYGIGESVAACRIRLNLQAVSTVSEDVLAAPRVEAIGRSFQSDEDAVHEAASALAVDAIGNSETTFVPLLLARWGRERQEGYVVALKVEGLTGTERDRLKQTLSDMRGFRRFVEEQHTARETILRFLTRRDTRSLRRDLAQFALSPSATPPRAAGKARQNSFSLTARGSETSESAPAFLRILNDRGPMILCAAHVSVSK